MSLKVQNDLVQMTRSVSHNASLVQAATASTQLAPLVSTELIHHWPTPIIPIFVGESQISTDYLKLLLTAKVYEVAIETPLHFAPKLSSKLGSTIYLKREDLQPNFSFKCRGAYNKMVRLSKEEKLLGVCCVSAGNHAQGVAIAAKKLGIKAKIFMPKFAPEIKVEAVRRLGANVVLYGGDFDEAKLECMRIKAIENLVFIPPFDDKFVIAGQGTVGIEISKQLRQDRLDAIFVCCGGGGLLAGIAAYIKRIHPETKVIGVNTVDSDSMYQSLVAGKVINIPTAGLFSDGTSVRQGEETFKICRELVDDFVLVMTDEICSAIRDTFDETRTVLEPSGALALAGLKKYLSNNPQLSGGVYVAVTSGANMNFDRLRFVADRSKTGDGKEVLVSCIIPNKLGSFLGLYTLLMPRLVTEFSYRKSNGKNAAILIAFEVLDQVDGTLTIQKLSDAGFETENLTQNEVAISHIRFLGGGRQEVEDELLIRFQFPERPGKLTKFLEALDNVKKWNISLLHYRNLGSDIAKVLVGIQVSFSEHLIFFEFLDNLGFPYTNESNNSVFGNFLK